MNKRETCGQRMEKRRTELRLTQAEVAEKVKLRSKYDNEERTLSVNAYAMYERDAIDLPVRVVEGIAAVLCVPPGWLAFGTGTSAPAGSLAELVH